jgi:hypothetical protein
MTDGMASAGKARSTMSLGTVIMYLRWSIMYDMSFIIV